MKPAPTRQESEAMATDEIRRMALCMLAACEPVNGCRGKNPCRSGNPKWLRGFGWHRRIRQALGAVATGGGRPWAVF